MYLIHVHEIYFFVLGDDISAELDRIYKDSPCICGNCQDNPRGTPIWVAIVKHLAITDLSVQPNER